MDRLQEFKDQVDANYKNLATRLDRLETNWRRIPDQLEESEHLENSRSPWHRRVQPYNTENTVAHHIKSVQLDAPSFSGCLYPQTYIDWQLAMDHYFRWRDMSESKKIQFIMMKFTG